MSTLLWRTIALAAATGAISGLISAQVVIPGVESCSRISICNYFSWGMRVMTRLPIEDCRYRQDKPYLYKD